ncbi:hypothetical protein Tco_1517648 [Tanacetum coccineum]
MIEDMLGALATDETELGRRMTNFVTTRDRRAHPHTALLMKREAKLSCKAWRRSMDASDLARSEVMALRTQVVAQQSEIAGLRALSKRKFVIVCHEKVVRISLEGDEILRVHGERTQGVVKTLMNTKKGRVKLRRVRAMSMTIQSSVKDKILVTPSETSKGMMRTVVMDEAHASRYLVHPGADKTYYNLGDMYCLRYLSENEIESPWILSVNFQDNSKEWNSGDDQLRLRWMIYLVVLADAVESVRDTIRFEYCLASSSGWTKRTIRCAPFEALYGRKCRLPVLWDEIGESSLIGPELVQETTDKVLVIKEKFKAARDRVIRFGKKGKLAPRYVGPFEILERVGPVAYQLRLPEELSGVDKTLRFVEEPVENSDREVKRLKCSRMVVVKAKWLAVRYLVKVSWNSKCNFELTWVWEDYLKDKYPRFIVCNPWSSLIPLSRGSFDVIVGIDWLSKRKFVIVCHKKVVRIPLEGDEILRVYGERTLGAAKALMNAKFRIDLVPGATSIAKSPYRLAPLKMKELSEQLQEFGEQGFPITYHFREEHAELFVGVHEEGEASMQSFLSVIYGLKKFMFPSSRGQPNVINVEPPTAVGAGWWWFMVASAVDRDGDDKLGLAAVVVRMVGGMEWRGGDGGLMGGGSGWW